MFSMGPRNANKTALLASVWVVACVTACEPMNPALHAPQAGGSGLLVVTDVPDPYQLDRMVVVIDGSVAMTEPPPSGARWEAPAPALAPGTHFLEIRAELSVPCGLLADDRQRIVLGTHRVFDAGSS